jgi:hypothetical protein
MSSRSWSLSLPDGRHQIDIDYGHFHLAQILVDGQLVSMSRPLLRMTFEGGVDLPAKLGQHEVLVSVRPILGRFGIYGLGYFFGLEVDGALVPGTDPVQPLALTRSRNVEAWAWIYGLGGVIALRQRVDFATILFLGGPAACSWVTRRTILPARFMALVCLVIIVVALVVVAVVDAAVRS